MVVDARDIVQTRVMLVRGHVGQLAVRERGELGRTGPGRLQHLAGRQAADRMIWPKRAGRGQHMALIVMLVGRDAGQVAVVAGRDIGELRTGEVQTSPLQAAGDVVKGGQRNAAATATADQRPACRLGDAPDDDRIKPAHQLIQALNAFHWLMPPMSK